MSSLNDEVISAIFLSQFLVVIQPYSSSDQLEEDDTLRFGLVGTTVHPSSSYPAYFSFTSALGYQLDVVIGFVSSAYSLCVALCSFVSYSQSSSSEYQVADSSPSSAISKRSSFQWMGGGSFLKDSPNPSFLQSMYVIAISSMSTCESEAISPVFFANSLTSSSAFSSQSMVYISNGNVYTNYLVFRSFNSPKTSSVVTILQVELRFLILLMEMKALASRTAIDFLSVCIVEQILILAQRISEITEYQEKDHFTSWIKKRSEPSSTSKQGMFSRIFSLVGLFADPEMYFVQFA